MLKKLFPFSLLGFLFSGCEGLRSSYHIESDTVFFYSGFPARASMVEGADVKSFEKLDSDYGKDKYHVYHKSYVIENADPVTFKVIDWRYSKDKNHGYGIGSNGPGAVVPISNDPEHFEAVPNNEETATNRTAEGTIYVRDRQHVYDGKDIVPLADPATFEYVPMRSGSGFNLARDKRYVYWRNQPLPGADGSTFEALSGDFFKDAKAIWSTKVDNRGNFSWVTLPGADMATFVIVDKERGLLAKDKNYHYSNGEAFTPKPPQQAAKP